MQSGHGEIRKYNLWLEKSVLKSTRWLVQDVGLSAKQFSMPAPELHAWGPEVPGADVNLWQFLPEGMPLMLACGIQWVLLCMAI